MMSEHLNRPPTHILFNENKRAEIVILLSRNRSKEPGKKFLEGLAIATQQLQKNLWFIKRFKIERLKIK